MTDHNQQPEQIQLTFEFSDDEFRKFCESVKQHSGFERPDKESSFFWTHCPHCFALISDYPCHICKKQSPGMLGFNYSEVMGLSEWLFDSTSNDTPTFALVALTFLKGVS